MKLDEAMASGLPIRTPEMGFQFLAPQETDGDTLYTLSGALNPPHSFSNFDRLRSDWEVVEPQAQVAPKNPVLEASFSEADSAEAAQ